MGCYQEGIAKDSVAGKDVTAHIFEYTSSVVCSDSGEVSMGACPVQIIFCLKEQNKKKLNRFVDLDFTAVETASCSTRRVVTVGSSTHSAL